ncbi:MAG: 5-dehydro-4-deoxy-D-glucuronate isomerase [Chloroflexi bacterium]|nr:MAG: 5-dehydro-4-deoxy-D-glucuronate isomerase [Chloroflexota bacterium]
MDMRYAPHPEQTKTFTTQQLREHFLIERLFTPGQIEIVYSHIDRIITGGACPAGEPFLLAGDPKTLGAEFFLQRREMGVVNVGGPGQITVDGQKFPMQKLDGLYVGQGSREVCFESSDPGQPARFYLSSTPAHAAYPTAHIPISQATPQHLGDLAHSNERTIYKYIHPDGVKSCQLVMGVTLLEPNNMWNTMPVHTHVRRMEVYFYFDIADNNVVFHLMGQPDETRHVIVRNEQAVISPSWSIHSGVGTGNYAFIWAMAGENQTFSDMDPVTMGQLA